MHSESEVHISSLVVHALPEGLERVTAEIAESTCASVEVQDASGKLVVLLETANQKEVLDQIERINKIDGVISASLIYHHIDQPEIA